MISRYTGGNWWGSSWYAYFYDQLRRLSRERPSQGYFYMRLNADRMTSPEPGWDDAKFWAAKIAHEVLHNLGYWHPNYADSQERDENNKNDMWAFIVSFEDAVLEYLRSE